MEWMSPYLLEFIEPYHLSTTELPPLSTARHNNELPALGQLGFAIFPMRATCSTYVVIILSCD
jgi:hypothetical protein